MWKLWLDDQWNDPDAPERHCPEGFIPAGSVDEAMALVRERGLPEFIDFDHDLGGTDAPVLIQMLFLHVDGTDYQVPEYNVHSANPVGKQNIISLMESWKKIHPI